MSDVHPHQDGIQNSLDRVKKTLQNDPLNRATLAQVKKELLELNMVRRNNYKMQLDNYTIKMFKYMLISLSII